MIKELTEIRNELLLGVESKDLLYIKMQINNLDTLIYKSTIANKKSGNINNNPYDLNKAPGFRKSNK